MPDPSTTPPPVKTVRGNMILRGDDARLWGKLVTHLTHNKGDVINSSTVITDAIRCYAEKLNITLDA